LTDYRGLIVIHCTYKLLKCCYVNLARPTAVQNKQLLVSIKLVYSLISNVSLQKKQLHHYLKTLCGIYIPCA